MPSSLWGKRPSNIGPTRNVPKVVVPKTAAPTKSTISKYTSLPRTASSRPRSRTPQDLQNKRSDSKGSVRLGAPQDGTGRKRSPAFQRVESDSEDDGEGVSFDLSSRPKYKIISDVPVDLKRDFSSTESFTAEYAPKLIHASDIASRKKGFLPALSLLNDDDDVCVELQYPGSAKRERYELVGLKEDFNPIAEIIEVVQAFTDFFPTSAQAEIFTNPESGIKRKLERYSSGNICDLEGFKSAILAYNSEVDKMRIDGTLLSNIKEKHNLPYGLVECVMLQAYDRTVSPQVEKLKKYENGTDHVYGELKSGFVFNILAETKLKSDQVFVDLGSGVANVVLQAALQVGCESWGCEIMENTCDVAEEYKAEIEARCRLWGITPGKVILERGDFTINDKIRDALKRADVVLVNNRVFTPNLNDTLVRMFLDCKNGCKIVSLGSFVPANHKITTHNLNNPVNLLEVEQRLYPAKSVSWTNAGGEYFISTKRSKIALLERSQLMMINNSLDSDLATSERSRS